jgi:coenzyme F420 hydrogenase subunit beta
MAKRGAIGGRVAMMRMLGLPVTQLRGFSLFKNWRRLTFGEKLRSTLGTIRRIITRRYFRPLQLNATESQPKPLSTEARSLTEVS